jgi:Mn2+/Fe2+ NRAMP family transporter
MNDSQAKFTFLTVLAGIGFLLIVFVVTIVVFKDAERPAETIVAVLGAVTGVLGTLVGYVAGQAGRERAEQRAHRAERQMAAVLDTCGPGTLDQARTANPDLFR